MILTRTPLRISFIGGGTDYPQWSSNHGGIVVGSTIDKYSYVTARYLPPFHEFKTRVVYSEIEHVLENSDVKHNAIRAVLKLLKMDDKHSPGLEINHLGDMPGRSGMGSSSTFVVGLINALATLKGEALLPDELAKTAIHVEHHLLGETVGCQDQVWASVGGLNKIEFTKQGHTNIYPIPLDRDQIASLESRLLLFYTGITRTASDVAGGYASELFTNGKLQFTMMHLAEQGVRALERCDWEGLGVLLDRAWQLKRTLAGVTNHTIDRYYAIGRMAGAIGGKLLGSGGGGCLLFVIPQGNSEVAEALSKEGLVHVPFKFDFTGSKIVFFDRENIDEYRRVA